MTYEEALAVLLEYRDEEYRAFHKKLLNNDEINVIGIRMPVLRKLSKAWKGELSDILTFPNDYYEIVFLKCAVTGLLPFEAFCEKVDDMVALLDNWATCDCFAAPCIEKHKEEFLPYIKKYLADSRVFVRRYGLVTLLHYYVEERYLPLIFESILKSDEKDYYVMMAAAWLFAEVLVKFYDRGVAVLKEGTVAPKIHNKGIQKARESFRLTPAQKEELKSLKR